MWLLLVDQATEALLAVTPITPVARGAFVGVPTEFEVALGTRLALPAR